MLDLELEKRKEARILLRYKQSKLTEKPTIDQFDFKYHRSQEKQKNKIISLMPLEFVGQHMDVKLIGNPGVGKTFLAKCIVRGDSGQYQGFIYHRNGYDQSFDCCRSRPFAVEKTSLLSISGTACL